MTLNLREIMDQHQIFLGAPDAVQKMRELVLQLAVMGKLTIQDDEDGNARDLLEDLASNRSALIAEKRIRNTRSSVPDVTKPDPFSLPRNWVWCTLDQLGYFLGGKTPSRANPTYWDGTVLWVSPKDMKTGEIFDSELKITERALENAGMTLIPAGSILVVARSGILRRRLPVAIARTRLTVNQDLKALVPYIKGMEKFIALMLLGNEARILRQYVKTGTTVQSLEFDKFRAAKFGLPPLAEQHRIVAKVDELMAECDALEEELTRARELRRRATRATLTVLTAPDQGKVDIRNHWRRLRDNFDGLIQTPESVQELRQTILQLAVMGKLVEQREEDGDARELLERIFLHASERNLNIRAPQEVIGAYPVPQAWAWVRLGCIGKTRTGKTPRTANSEFYGGEVGFIGPGSLQRDGRLAAPEKWLSEAGVEAGALAEPGSVLMVCIGGSIGKSHLVTERVAFNQQINCIDPLFVPAGYVSIVFKSPYFLEQVWDQATGSATPIINGSRWSNIPIPLPPLAEQRRIVAKVDELMARCDALDVVLQENARIATDLFESIVASAMAA